MPAFRELLHEANDSLPAFYQRVRELGALPKPARDAALDALARRAAAGAMSADSGKSWADRRNSSVDRPLAPPDDRPASARKVIAVD